MLVPLPLEAKVSLPGARFAAATSSCTDFIGEDGLTTSTLLKATSGVTKEKSFIASNGSFS